MEKSINQNPDLDQEPIDQSSLINLGSLFEILVRRRKIFVLFGAAFFLISSSNLIYKRVRNPIYRGSFSIMISDPFTTNRNQNSSLENLALNRETLDIPTLIQYLKSPGVVSNVAQNNNISPRSLTNRINISIPRNSGGLGGYLTRILKISLDGKNKIKMQKILNDLSEQYIINASESRNEKLSEGIKFLNIEKPNILFKLGEAQSKLETFRLENKLIDPISEGQTLSKLIEKTKNDILNVKSENIRLLFIKDNLVNGILYTEGINNGNSSNNGAGLGIIGSDQLLLQEILEVKSQLANAQSKFKKNSVVVKNLTEKLSQLEPILLKNQKSAVEAAIIVNNSIIKSYENQLSELRSQFIAIPGKVTEYSTIIKNLDALENNLKSLNETKDKLELELSQGILPWKIINEPLINPSPIKPEIQRNLIYILIGTFSFASLITFIFEKYDDVFHNTKEVEKFIKIPTLGFIPFFNFNIASDQNKANDFITISNLLETEKMPKGMKFIFEETFRNIYTSIKFSKSDKDIKVINVTSTIPEEGKSLCSLFLALNVAQIQKKVLIVDTDLRKPSLHKKLDVDNISGISNYLVNKEKDWKKYVNQHKSCENLFFITAGKIPPNSISLLESKKMASLLNDLRNSEEYDFIILDCPPLLGLSDALIISKYVDASLLTISLNKVNKTLAQGCLDKLKLLQGQTIGTIINSVTNIDTKGFLGSSYYQYGNQYNYYSYKYMPTETQNRYIIEENKNQLEKENFLKEFSSNQKFSKKIKFILNRFKKWLDE